MYRTGREIGAATESEKKWDSQKSTAKSYKREYSGESFGFISRNVRPTHNAHGNAWKYTVSDTRDHFSLLTVEHILGLFIMCSAVRHCQVGSTLMLLISSFKGRKGSRQNKGVLVRKQSDTTSGQAYYSFLFYVSLLFAQASSHRSLNFPALLCCFHAYESSAAWGSVASKSFWWGTYW
jgi:hypothetical protein